MKILLDTCILEFQLTNISIICKKYFTVLFRCFCTVSFLVLVHVLACLADNRQLKALNGALMVVSYEATHNKNQ